MKYITIEAIPVNLLAVELDESPVLRIAFVTRTNGNRRGICAASQDALVLRAPELRDLTVEVVQGLYRLLRFLY
jgi:hypothetical protein